MATQAQPQHLADGAFQGVATITMANGYKRVVSAPNLPVAKSKTYLPAWRTKLA
jgi:hypothetical protein